MVLDRRELSYVLSEVLGLPRNSWKGKAYDVVQAIIKVLVTALQQGETIKIDGFGIFKPFLRTRTRFPCYYYPYLNKKGLYTEVKTVPRKLLIVFKPSKVLKRLVNQNVPDTP